MTRYRTRVKRFEDGKYTASYGKGSKKLTAQVYTCDEGDWAWSLSHNGQYIGGVIGFKLKRDAIADFSQWASENYNDPQPFCTMDVPDPQPLLEEEEYEETLDDTLSKWDAPTFSRLMRRYGADNVRIFIDNYESDGEHWIREVASKG